MSSPSVAAPGATPATAPYDALVLLSFGGPERPEDVVPFLENVTRGRGIPRERLEQVGEHYFAFGGRSPINDQNTALLGALRAELARRGADLPVVWGNRNWDPYLTDALREASEAGARRVLVLTTSAYASYSGCRQYREDIERAREAIGPGAPRVEKLRAFYNHPGFVGPNVENLRAALEQIPEERRRAARVAFTAHSVPALMAAGCDYERQLLETCRLTASGAGAPSWRLVFQSRSGPPTQPWLEPDICEHLRELKEAGTTDVVVAPVGFISDHMEVLYDLDTEARQLSQEIGVNMVRAATVGAHPEFVRMIRELILERLDPAVPRRALGALAPSHDVCPTDCCLPGALRPPARLESNAG